MKLQTLRLCNFQSFGPTPTDLDFDDVTYLIGANGTGKTAALQALCRLFSFDPSLRRIQRSDFHVPTREKEFPEERNLWIEANFIFPELVDNNSTMTIAPFFNHMRLDSADSPACVRYRLEATMGQDGDIEETLVYVLSANEDGTPLSTQPVTRFDRNHIQVHYLPAKRDPAEHITYSTTTLIGRFLRSANWNNEKNDIKHNSCKISNTLASNKAISSLGEQIKTTWGNLHKGNFFSDPKITFASSEIEAILRHVSLSFSPGHNENTVDFTRLSDGQKSMLYLSLVISSQNIGRQVLAGENNNFDSNKLRPAIFTIIALEEPENSLSPYYLGRIINALKSITDSNDAQAVITTHAPSMLYRVHPREIRYMRLSGERSTEVSHIILPNESDEAYKFICSAVQAYPEIYFSKLAVLGEGDSEQIIIPRILQAKGIPVDESAITVAPLGGRHVNHFWRLLSNLKIPYVTLLDLDIGRYQGGWGRINYVSNQLDILKNGATKSSDVAIPKWDDRENPIRRNTACMENLEQTDVFFSSPLDIDFSMMSSFPEEYSVERENSSESIVVAVLGKRCNGIEQYSNDEKNLFSSYHKKFKLSSKPATHLNALAQLTDEKLIECMPESLGRLADKVKSKLEGLPE